MTATIADTDSDGLTDTQETTIGTNPNNPDSDGDSLSDGAEVTLGTNPLNADTDSDGTRDNLDSAPTYPSIGGTGGSGGTPVPIMNGWWLLPGALAGVGLLRRRRKD